MPEAFLYGFLTGMVMSVMLGTVFFALVQNSIDHGFRSGMFISAGVIISDIILISLSWFNAELIPEGGTTDLIVRSCGGAFLLFYGISNLLKKKKAAYPVTEKKHILKYMTMGFFLNILNPGNYIGWLAVTTNLKAVGGYKLSHAMTYYTGALGAIFMLECLISLGASFVKRFITDKFLQMVDRVVGVLFIGFALFLIFPVVMKLVGA
ncbi:MAG: LysE family transporter [Bacteroidia bacterium]